MADIRKELITDTLEKNYMPYAMSVILSRALPEIDGFKPSHRKLLYTMYKMNLLSGGKTKSANVVGQTMKLNPHGDQAIYSTMVRMTRGNESLLLPYVDSKGNFGKVYSRDMQHAASRYTEVKLAPICNEVFKDIDKDTVDFVDNYDGTMYEPSLLPVRFPTILANPNKGIAVGMASNICSFNLGELARTTIEYIKDPSINIADYLHGPDFPTGGRIIRDDEVFTRIYEEGTGTFRIRGNFEYIKKGRHIEITEIPYTTTVEAIIEKIVDLIKAGKIREISDVRDETDLKGLKITIDVKKGTDVEKLMALLFKETTLEDTFSCNFNLLVNGVPTQTGVRGILASWLDFRSASIRRGLKYDIAKFEAKLHLINGLKKVLLDIDEVIATIRNTEKDAEVIPNLMKYFDLSEKQADYVANIKLRNINREYILDRISEASELENKIEENRKIYKSDKLLNKLIIKQLEEITKKHPMPRKSKIVENVIEHSEYEEVVEDYPVHIFYTSHGYVKKVSEASLKKANTQRLKDEDEILIEIETTNDTELLFFTNKGNVYKHKTFDLKDMKASELGLYVPNVVEMDSEEIPIYMVNTKDYSGYMIFGFENGKVAKVPLSSYYTKQNRKKLVNAYNTDDKLIGIYHILKDSDFIVHRITPPDKETVLMFNTKLVSEKTTRNTKGVQVMRMIKNSSMIMMESKEESKLKSKEKYRTEKIPMTGTNIYPINI